MPAHKKQHTTPHSSTVSQVPLEQVVAESESFHSYLREEIRQATRLVMEEIMSEEFTQFVGANWGEITPNRKGYRNGFYTHNLRTTNGQIEDLKVPRDREGEFHTSL